MAARQAGGACGPRGARGRTAAAPLPAHPRERGRDVRPLLLAAGAAVWSRPPRLCGGGSVYALRVPSEGKPEAAAHRTPPFSGIGGGPSGVSSPARDSRPAPGSRGLETMCRHACLSGCLFRGGFAIPSPAAAATRGSLSRWWSWGRTLFFCYLIEDFRFDQVCGFRQQYISFPQYAIPALFAQFCECF